MRHRPLRFQAHPQLSAVSPDTSPVCAEVQAGRSEKHVQGQGLGRAGRGRKGFEETNTNSRSFYLTPKHRARESYVIQAGMKEQWLPLVIKEFNDAY